MENWAESIWNRHERTKLVENDLKNLEMSSVNWLGKKMEEKDVRLNLEGRQAGSFLVTPHLNSRDTPPGISLWWIDQNGEIGSTHFNRTDEGYVYKDYVFREISEIIEAYSSADDCPIKVDAGVSAEAGAEDAAARPSQSQ